MKVNRSYKAAALALITEEVFSRKGELIELSMLRTCVACAKCCKHTAARNRRTVLVSCSRCGHTVQGKYCKAEWVR